MDARNGLYVNVVFDCEDADRLARFWMEALDYVPYSPSSPIAGWRSIVPRDPIRGGPRVVFQVVADPKRGKNRLHLDLKADDVEVEASRLSRLGATRLTNGTVHEHGHDWIVMQDPEGNEFCVDTWPERLRRTRAQ
ncbi:MAG TPA: VOC family protein [Acidimicrobiales bacterium]|nr:VOC family protein [Acidimicrobiales bacterium]